MVKMPILAIHRNDQWHIQLEAPFPDGSMEDFSWVTSHLVEDCSWGTTCRTWWASRCLGKAGSRGPLGAGRQAGVLARLVPGGLAGVAARLVPDDPRRVGLLLLRAPRAQICFLFFLCLVQFCMLWFADGVGQTADPLRQS